MNDEHDETLAERVVNAVRDIQMFCGTYSDCSDCPLEDDSGDCPLDTGRPYDWDIHSIKERM